MSSLELADALIFLAGLAVMLYGVARTPASVEARRALVRREGLPGLAKRSLPSLLVQAALFGAAALRAGLSVLWWLLFSVVALLAIGFAVFWIVGAPPGLEPSGLRDAPVPDRGRASRRIPALVVMAAWLWSWRHVFTGLVD